MSHVAAAAESQPVLWCLVWLLLMLYPQMHIHLAQPFPSLMASIAHAHHALKLKTFQLNCGTLTATSRLSNCRVAQSADSNNPQVWRQSKCKVAGGLCYATRRAAMTHARAHVTAPIAACDGECDGRVTRSRLSAPGAAAAQVTIVSAIKAPSEASPFKLAYGSNPDNANPNVLWASTLVAQVPGDSSSFAVVRNVKGAAACFFQPQGDADFTQGCQ